MGSTFSSSLSPHSNTCDTLHTMSDNETKENHSIEINQRDNNENEYEDTKNDQDEKPSTSEQDLIEFKKELEAKREERKRIIARVTSEKTQLKKSLDKERAFNIAVLEENEMLREILKNNNICIPDCLSKREDSINEFTGIIASLNETSKSLEELREHNKKLRIELSETHLALQLANTEITDMYNQNAEAMKQITALKEVVSVSKSMVKIRENQLEDLKARVEEIKKSLASKEASLLSTDLRQEYERSLQNIKDLRVLYEERARLAEITKRNLARDLEDQKLITANEITKCKEMSEKVEGLEEKIIYMNETIASKDEQIRMIKSETKSLKSDMSAINKLFSQMLLGYNSQQNLDKLVTRLEEHHDILTHMVTKEADSDCSALPKLLLELVNQIEDPQEKAGQVEQDIKNEKLTSPEEIVGNLPKVWRVLLELLSHQSGLGITNEIPSTSCYKSVDTPSGPRMIPSVSQTYIRLKDLIVEKVSLVKDMNKMKRLNNHLETRLKDQERRLCLVTSELTKTWHVVGRLRRHHHQLHTHEKILRYELQQKRKLLNEIKGELEYCKEKWDRAREKNHESEKEWRKLRTEFSNRKRKPDVFNTSNESGYSDDHVSDDDSSDWVDESEYVDEQPNRLEKKANKNLILDSSTDNNPIAEGDDPISDMHDIADLPLDGQETDDHQNKLSQSKELMKSLMNVNEIPESETNDEAYNDNMNPERKDTGIHYNMEISKTDIQSTSGSNNLNSEPVKECLICPAEILANVQRQNERLAERDKRLTNMESGSKDLIDLLSVTVYKGNVLSQNADEILRKNTGHHQPSTTSGINGTEVKPINKNTTEIAQTNLEPSSTALESTTISLSTDYFASSYKKKLITPSEILENLKKQKERLENRDERFLMMEAECKKLVEHTTTQFNNGIKLVEKSNELIDKKKKTNMEEPESAKCSDDVEASTSEMPSFSSDNDEISDGKIISDHEARFAARDERLKRLEEQTKSLVDKVNGTTSKSVKINYKLEELHNIYGSETKNESSDEENGK